MKAKEIVEELRGLGSPSIKKVLMAHGAPEPIFGVKVEELQKIRKRIKKDYQLALDLFDTGIYDAMYLAGLVADDPKMSREDLQRWAERAHCHGIAEYTVAWVAAESSHGWEMALRWIDSSRELTAAAGWSTLSSLMSIKPDAELDLPTLKKLLGRVKKTIHSQPNQVRYTMNGFVIAVGAYVVALTAEAEAAAKAVGPVQVDMGGTACKVPEAVGYIDKIRQRGSLGKKRKTAKC